MRPQSRQISIMDFLEDKDWIDKIYLVWKAYHNGEWTEYSPKFLNGEDAKEWRMTHGEQLCDRFGRKLKLFTARPADSGETFYIHYKSKGEDVTKCVPGDDFFDAVDNLLLFVTDIDEVGLGFKNK